MANPTTRRSGFRVTERELELISSQAVTRDTSGQSRLKCGRANQHGEGSTATDLTSHPLQHAGRPPTLC